MNNCHQWQTRKQEKRIIYRTIYTSKERECEKRMCSEEEWSLIQNDSGWLEATMLNKLISQKKDHTQACRIIIKFLMVFIFVFLNIKSGNEFRKPIWMCVCVSWLIFSLFGRFHFGSQMMPKDEFLACSQFSLSCCHAWGASSQMSLGRYLHEKRVNFFVTNAWSPTMTTLSSERKIFLVEIL